MSKIAIIADILIKN